jgi:hypothetical protein
MSTQLTNEIYNKWIHIYLRNNFIPLVIISHYFRLNYNLLFIVYYLQFKVYLGPESPLIER